MAVLTQDSTRKTLPGTTNRERGVQEALSPAAFGISAISKGAPSRIQS